MNSDALADSQRCVEVNQLCRAGSITISNHMINVVGCGRALASLPINTLEEAGLLGTGRLCSLELRHGAPRRFRVSHCEVISWGKKKKITPSCVVFFKTNPGVT